MGSKWVLTNTAGKLELVGLSAVPAQIYDFCLLHWDKSSSAGHPFCNNLTFMY